MLLNLGGCHVESKNSGERASGIRNHTRHLYLGLFVGGHSGVSFGVFGGARQAMADKIFINYRREEFRPRSWSSA